MIHVRYSDINNPMFKEAILELAKQPLPIKTLYKFKRITDMLDVNIKEFSKKYNELINKYVVRNEDGIPKVKLNEEGVPVGYDMVDSEESNKEHNDLMETMFSIEQYPIEYHEIEKANLTLQQFSAISCILPEEGNENVVPLK